MHVQRTHRHKKNRRVTFLVITVTSIVRKVAKHWSHGRQPALADKLGRREVGGQLYEKCTG